MTDRTLAPAASNDFQFIFLAPEKITLANGIQLWLVNGAKQDLLRVEWIWPAGNSYEPMNMVASAANDLLGEGTASHTAEQMNEALDYYGAYLSRETGRDHATLALFTLNKHLPEVLPLVMEVITASAYPDHELDIYLKNRKARYLDGLKKVEYVCRNRFASLLFGKHPYGRPLEITDFDRVTSDRVKAFYQSHYSGTAPLVFVAGKIEEAEKQLLVKALEQLPPAHTTLQSDALPAYQPGRRKVHMEDAIQTAIRIGKPLITLEHPDYPVLSVMNTILGGYFGSRLMKNIREEKGFTYGIGSALSSFEKSGMFVIATEVGKEVTAQALEEIYKEMQILRQEPVTEEELTTVKNYLLGNFLKSLDGPFAQTDKIKTIVVRNLADDYYRTYIERMKATTAADIQRVAQTYLNPDSLSELVVGHV